jgi:hypothetical protein
MKMLHAVLLTLALVAAQAATAAQAPVNVAGNWQGTLMLGPQSIRVGMVVTTSGTGYAVTLVVIDQDGATLPADQVTLTGNALHLQLNAIKGAYDGTLSADGRQFTGTLTQGGTIPLNFTRVEKLDPPTTFEEADKVAVRALIDRYFSSFTAKDWDTFRMVVQTPFILWSVGAVPNALTSVDDVVARSRTTREGLDGTGYAVSRAARTIITPLSSAAALVDIHWRRDKADGSLFGEGAEILAVVKTPAGWKVVGNMPRQLSQFGKTSLSAIN